MQMGTAPFLPGTSLVYPHPGQRSSRNHGGRHRGLERYVREATGGGVAMVDLMVSVLYGTAVEMREAQPLTALSLKMDAATWLADRGFAKPKDDDDAGQAGGLALQLALVLSQLPPGVVEQLQRAMLSAGQADPVYTIDAPARETTIEPQPNTVPSDGVE